MAILTTAIACNIAAFQGSVPRPNPSDDLTPTFFVDPTVFTPAVTSTGTAETNATATPEQDAIPSPTGCGYWSQFVEDVTVPDGTEFAPGESFEKIWRFRNNGCLDWPDTTQMYFLSGDQMGGPDAIDVPAVAFNATVDLTVPLVAPDEPGTYTGYWQIIAPDGAAVGPYVYVQIEVIEGGEGDGDNGSSASNGEAPSWEPFVGTWVNGSAEDGRIAQVTIAQQSESLTIQRWDMCGSETCNQGSVTTPVGDTDDGILVLTWTGAEAGDDAYKTEMQRLAILLDGRLQITGAVDFEDEDRDDFAYTSYLTKSSD